MGIPGYILGYGKSTGKSLKNCEHLLHIEPIQKPYSILNFMVGESNNQGFPWVF